MTYVNGDAVMRRTKRPGNGHAAPFAGFDRVIDHPGVHGHGGRFVKEHYQRQAIGKGTLHGVAGDHEAISHTVFPLHKNVMALSASSGVRCCRAKLLGAIIAKVIVQYHRFLWSRE